MERVVTADGFSLSVQDGGVPDGPVLLLLAGQANSHAWWTGLREAFDCHFRVVSFDWRGTGGSRGPVGDWSTAGFAEDAAAVLRALGCGAIGAGGPVAASGLAGSEPVGSEPVVEGASAVDGGRAAVYGTSMGGRVAQVLAARHPELVERLVLACTSPGGRNAHERTPEVRRRLADPDVGARMRTMRELFYTEAWSGQSHLFGDPTMSPEESRAHLRASNRHDAWDELPLIKADTLVMHGTDDVMVPSANAPLIAARIPGAKLHLREGGRHGFFDEFAAELSPLVSDFLG